MSDELDEIDVEELSLEELKSTYRELMHGVQSGVRMRMNDPTYDAANPKHLRVGINAAMVTDKALATILMEKDIMTEEEYFRHLVEAAIDEVKMLEGEVSDQLGSNVSLR